MAERRKAVPPTPNAKEAEAPVASASLTLGVGSLFRSTAPREPRSFGVALREPRSFGVALRKPAGCGVTPSLFRSCTPKASWVRSYTPPKRRRLTGAGTCVRAAGSLLFRASRPGGCQKSRAPAPGFRSPPPKNQPPYALAPPTAGLKKSTCLAPPPPPAAGARFRRAAAWVRVFRRGRCPVPAPARTNAGPPRPIAGPSRPIGGRTCPMAHPAPLNARPEQLFTQKDLPTSV